MSQKLELLKKVDIFKSLDNSAQNRLENLLGKSVTCEGEDLAVNGGQALFFFILISGQVIIYTEDEKAVVFGKPGDFMGFELVSSKGRYKATIKALEDGEVFLLDRKKFLAMLQEDIPLAKRIMSSWGKYLLKTAPFIEKLDFTGKESIY